MKFILVCLLIIMANIGILGFCLAVFYEDYIETEIDKKWFYFWLILAVILTVSQVYFYIDWHNNNAKELLKYTECSNNYCGTTEDMCKTDERIISCKEYTHYNKKIIEERYLYVVPYCNDNTWDAKICKTSYTQNKQTKYRYYLAKEYKNE